MRDERGEVRGERGEVSLKYVKVLPAKLLGVVDDMDQHVAHFLVFGHESVGVWPHPKELKRSNYSLVFKIATTL